MSYNKNQSHDNKNQSYSAKKQTYSAKKQTYSAKKHYNKNQSYDNNPQRRNNKQNGNKRNNNIFILTQDDYYFIIDKTTFRKSGFFENMFALDKHAGKLRNPLFLQKVKSEYFKLIIKYLENHNGKSDNFDPPQGISINDLCSFYDNDMDKRFFKDLYNKDDPEFMLELINAVKYFQIDNLYKKLKYCHEFYINIKTYNLYDI